MYLYTSYCQYKLKKSDLTINQTLIETPDDEDEDDELLFEFNGLCEIS